MPFNAENQEIAGERAARQVFLRTETYVSSFRGGFLRLYSWQVLSFKADFCEYVLKGKEMLTDKVVFEQILDFLM